VRTSRNRVIALIGLLAVVGAFSVGVGFAVTEGERQQVAVEAHKTSELLRLTDDLSTEVNSAHSAIDSLLLSGDPAARAEYAAASTEVTGLVAQIQTGAAGQPVILTELAGVTDALAAWEQSYAAPAIAAVQRGDQVAIRTLAAAAIRDDDTLRSALGDLTAQADNLSVSMTQRADSLTTTRTIGTLSSMAVMFLAALVSVWFVRRYSNELDRSGEAIRAGADRSKVLNRFTEVTSFAADDASVARSTLEALGLLVHPDAAVTHVLNRSKDRAVPEAMTGEAVAEVLPLHTLSQCPGIIRGTIYVVEDATEPLRVHCPIYPVSSGALACVPLISGETVGAIHLYWNDPGAFPLEHRSTVARVSEHGALAISNRRLVAALQGQASTDARTGLANSRAFDDACEAALAARAPDQTLAIMMLDLDRFKDFNDRRGHPAGDEALRTFANVLRSALRDGDMAARYGGEEFSVLLPRVDQATAIMIAERIRSRIEATVLALAPGITDRITVSIGIAMAPTQGTERVGLLRLADEALYHAKAGGRNAIRLYGEPTPISAAPAAVAS
jgi:diguanylate cyclase (GGDEF)-like protein